MFSASPTAPGMTPTTPTVTPQACPPGSVLTSRGCLRSGQFAPALTTNPQPTQPPLCPAPWMIATSVGCLYPAGTITAFDARRGKWRIAVTFDVLRPPPLPVPPRTLTPMTPTAAGFITALTPAAAMATPRSGFGGYFGQAVTHQSVAETDAPPQGVQQVDIATFAVAVGEPAPGGATSVTPPASTSTEPVPTTVEPPRVDVGPTTVPPSSSPPFVPPKVPGSQFPGSQFPATTSARPGEERDNFFRVNNPVMWFAIVGAVAAVGGGGYWLMRRRRRAA